MLLSIGMIVKNESNHLRKCLDALQPILNQVDSELIIADTGSTDDTLDIAREYTPHVLQVQWNDNFAEARNHTVRKAKGEWYMFLDADEYFEETDDLIEFFNSGEYKNYNFATHRIKNLVGVNEYEYGVVARLFRRHPKTKFVGIIHEGIPIIYPRKDLKSYSLHMGYYYVDDPVKLANKHERNFSLLLRAYNRDPLDVRNIAHLINQFAVKGDKEGQLKYIQIGFDLVKNKPQEDYFNYYYRRLTRFYLETGKDEDLDKVFHYADEYFSKKEHPSITSIDMYCIIGRAYQQRKLYKEAAEAFVKCWDLYQDYLQDRLDKSESVRDVFDFLHSSFPLRIPFEIVMCYSQLSDYENVFKWSKQVDFKIYNMMDIYFGYILTSGRFDETVNLYRIIAAYKDKDYAFYEKMRDTLDVNMLKSDNPAAFAASFADEETTDDFIGLQQLRHMDYTKNPSLLEKVQYFIKPEIMNNALENTSLYSEIAFFSFKNNVQFFEMVEMLDIDIAIDFIAQMSAKRKDFPLAVAQFAFLPVAQSADHLTAKSAYWLFCIYAQALSFEDALPDEVRMLLFDYYIAAFYRYMQFIYAPNVLTDDGISVLGGSFRFGYYMYKADACLASDDELGYMRNMKTALTHNSRYEKLIKLRINKYREEKKQKEVKENNELNDKLRLELLIRNLKATIKQYIEYGNTSLALKTLDEYEKINPKDEDIVRLRDEINNQINKK